MKKLCLAALAAVGLIGAALGQIVQPGPSVIVPGEGATLLREQNADAVKLTGGTIDGTVIGSLAPAAGTFTSLTATGAITATGGAGQFSPLFGGGTTQANASFQAPTVASAVNQVVVSGAATGADPSIIVGGTGADANRNLAVKGNGTGLVLLGQVICSASGTTPQTCNGQRGIVTTNSLATAAATDASFVINNSSVTAASHVLVTDLGYSGTLVTNGYPVLMSAVPGAGTITVHITNLHAANALAGTVKIGFAVLN